MDAVAIINGIGALCFGIVIGWICYRTIRRSSTSGLSDIATVIGAVGGAALTALFPQGTIMFGAYCIGLAIGFFAYLRTAIDQAGKAGEAAKVNEWLGGGPSTPTVDPQAAPKPRKLPGE